MIRFVESREYEVTIINIDVKARENITPIELARTIQKDWRIRVTNRWRGRS